MHQAILPVSLNLTQGGNTRDVITRQIGIGNFVGNVTGNVIGDGRLNIGANYSVTVSPGLVAVIEIGGWNTRISSTTGMTGGWAHTLRATSLSGNAYQENQIVSMTFNPATSGEPAAPTRRQDDGRELFHSMRPPTLVFPSLDAFAQSMRH